MLELLQICGLMRDSYWVSINPCSRWKYKEWGYGKWGELIDLLWANFRLPVVLVGSSGEAAICQETIAGRDKHAFNLAGKTTLGELAALLQLSAIHIGVDSAAPHIAAAVGTPTVTIFGPSNWKGWIIVDDFHRIVTSNMACIPCEQLGCENTGRSRCLDELEVAKLLEPIKEIWKRIKEVEAPAHGA
jgi:heptosyltransferase-3